jgi:hypothetical protein
MAAELAHDHDVTGTKRREKDYLHVEAEAVAVDRGCQEGCVRRFL